MEKTFNTQFYQRDDREFRSKNFIKSVPNNNLSVEISDASDCYQSEVSDRFAERPRLIPTYKYKSPQTMGSHRNKPPAVDPRFRKVHKTNPLTTQSEVTFDDFVRPEIESNLSSTPQLIPKEIPVLSKKPECFIPSKVLNPLPTHPEQPTNKPTSKEKKILHNSSQTDSSMFNITHNDCQTDPFPHLEIKNDNILPISKDERLLEIDKTLNFEIPIFNEWLMEESRKLESIMKPRSRKASEKSDHSSNKSYYSATSELLKDNNFKKHEENLFKVREETGKDLPYKLENIPVTNNGDSGKYQFNNSKPQELFSSRIMRLTDDVQNQTNINSIINIVLLLIAVTFASLVLLSFFYLIQPIVYIFVEFIHSLIFGEQIIEEEDTIINDGLFWLSDILKNAFKSLINVLSKKRKCSVSLFTSEKGC